MTKAAPLRGTLFRAGERPFAAVADRVYSAVQWAANVAFRGPTIKMNTNNNNFINELGDVRWKIRPST